ncbi:MAG: class I SAM-dependent methyltransferase [Thermodesulfobacteriota bacterium]
MTDDEYGGVASGYDLILSRPMRPIRRTIEDLVRDCDGNILDLCCGTGEQLRRLSDSGCRLTGVDLSPGMLKEARRKSPSSITYVEANAATVDLPVNSYDRVIICFALHEKKSETATAIYNRAQQLLNAEGKVIIADYCIPRPSLVSRLMGTGLIPFIERMAGRSHYSHYRVWCEHGWLEGFLGKEQNPYIVSRHLAGCAAVALIDKQNSAAQTRGIQT